MYENMKPKDAARIFDRLDMKILVDVSTQMNPRKMSDILAQMSPDAAERLTVRLANRAGGAQKTPWERTNCRRSKASRAERTQSRKRPAARKRSCAIKHG